MYKDLGITTDIISRIIVGWQGVQGQANWAIIHQNTQI